MRLLIVDDNDSIICLFKRTLANDSFDLKFAMTYNNGVKLLNDVDVVVSDWCLPDAKNGAMYKECMSRKIPVIIYTGMPMSLPDAVVIEKSYNSIYDVIKEINRICFDRQ